MSSKLNYLETILFLIFINYMGWNYYENTFIN